MARLLGCGAIGSTSDSGSEGSKFESWQPSRKTRFLVSYCIIISHGGRIRPKTIVIFGPGPLWFGVFFVMPFVKIIHVVKYDISLRHNIISTLINVLYFV